MSYKFTIQDEYRRLQCSECGVTYLFPETWCKKASQDGKSWKCPNGHGQWFGESKNDKLHRENNLMKQQLAEKDDAIKHARDKWDDAERRADAASKQVTALKKRAKNGTCPCCKRTFKNMQDHMQKMHPEFAGKLSKIAPLPN